MRPVSLLLIVLPIIPVTSATACPFGQAAEAGLLSKAHQAKYEAVKREGSAHTSAHVYNKDENLRASELEERAGNGLLPGLTLSGLKLPLGGGLRTYHDWLLTEGGAH